MFHEETQRPFRTFRHLDPEARVRELASLQSELYQPDPITHRRLTEWASVSDDRVALLRGAVWGGIRWSRQLGRPTTPSITGGFVLTHEFEEKKFSDMGGGDYRDDSHYVLQPAPSVWDATKSADEFRVGFFFFAGLGGINPNRLTVKLASVPWKTTARGRFGPRRLDPVGYAPFGDLGDFIVLPDFQVVHSPYRAGAYVEALGPSFEQAGA